MKTRSQTDGLGKSSIGTIMGRVNYGTIGTKITMANNMSTQTRQIHQSEVGANTNLTINNYTQTKRPIEKNMGVNAITPLSNTTQTLPSHNFSKGIYKKWEIIHSLKQ